MQFAKMEACGNDFVLINGLVYKIDDYGQMALKVCDRHFSVGADGMMVCETSDKADIKMIYYNSDGSRGEMCGNGIRCFAKFVYENGIVNKDIFTVDTLAGIKTLWLKTENKKVTSIKVNMGKAVFDPQHIPVDINKEKILEEVIEVDGESITFSSLLVGVPHTVIFVDRLEEVDVNKIGREIEKHIIFPKKTNVNFIEVISREKIKIATWERGAGRTLGCGTGSCASVVIGYMLGKLSEHVEVQTEGGLLEVALQQGNEIFMKGTASTICVGEFYNL
ncbi:diaminopimelate epimerase [Clostridiaceae bacterium 35-E11]